MYAFWSFVIAAFISGCLFIFGVLTTPWWLVLLVFAGVWLVVWLVLRFLKGDSLEDIFEAFFLIVILHFIADVFSG